MGSVSQYVYRMYNESRDLLYIGCTGNPQRRMQAHRYSTPWYGEVAETTYEPVRGMMRGFEREMVAIVEEHPRYNKIRTEPKGPCIEPLSEYACTLLTPEWKLRRRIYQGKLRGTRIGLRWFIHLDDRRDYHDGRGKRFRNAIWERDDVTFVSSDAIFKFGMFAGTIESAILAGELPARRLNAHYLLRYDDVARWQERREQEQARERQRKRRRLLMDIKKFRPHLTDEQWRILCLRIVENRAPLQVVGAIGVTREQVAEVDRLVRSLGRRLHPGTGGRPRKQDGDA